MGARAVWGAGKNSELGISWTTSEFLASTPTRGPLQPRTRGNGARRRNKEQNISDPFNDWGGGGDVTMVSPFWERTARK